MLIYAAPDESFRLYRWREKSYALLSNNRCFLLTQDQYEVLVKLGRTDDLRYSKTALEEKTVSPFTRKDPKSDAEDRGRSQTRARLAAKPDNVRVTCLRSAN